MTQAHGIPGAVPGEDSFRNFWEKIPDPEGVGIWKRFPWNGDIPKVSGAPGRFGKCSQGQGGNFGMNIP